MKTSDAFQSRMPQSRPGDAVSRTDDSVSYRLHHEAFRIVEEDCEMNRVPRNLISVIIVLSSRAAVFAQAPAGGRAAAPPRPVLSVTSPAWPDGAEVPMRNAFRGENKSPAFEFHWNLGVNPGTAPESLQTYAVIFHDVENSTNKTTADTLHWTLFNIPGSAKGLPEGLGSGDLPDGARNCPGLHATRGNPPAYF